VARDRLQEQALIPTLSLDGEVMLNEVDDGFVGDVERLAPFGMGNPRPVLCAKNVTVQSVRAVGQGHLQLDLIQGQAVRRAIAFGMAGRAPRVGAGLDVAFHPEHNTFRGERSIQLRVRDFREAE
jgi:single-stranded-DNA-specific exonuclease